jgi:hypothetical protein
VVVHVTTGSFIITSPFNDSSQHALWGVGEDPKCKMPIKVVNFTRGKAQAFLQLDNRYQAKDECFAT